MRRPWQLPALRATETENQVIRILPAPGKVAVDGKFDDWDLSGGIFACGDVERLRDQYGVWFHAMYDAENIYLLARWTRPHAAEQPRDQGRPRIRRRLPPGPLHHSFRRRPTRVVTWLTCWRDRDGISVVDRESPGRVNGVPDNVLVDPSRDAARSTARSRRSAVNADGKGYVQEMAIPWKMLSSPGKCPPAGSRSSGITVEPNFTAGPFGRHHDQGHFRRQVRQPDRIFTFRAYDHWGWATLLEQGNVEPQPVRLADSRTFP